MQESFWQILTGQAERYPLMMPSDHGKLAFQSEFGPEHMIADMEQARAFLLEEWRALPHDASPRCPEPIGGGLCRFPLSACRTAAEAGLLAELFFLTAKAHRGTKEGLSEKLSQLERLDVAGIKEWTAQWAQSGCPPVHHSDVYRDAYHPHYRLLKEEYALYFPVLVRILRLVQDKSVPNAPIVSIDGRCGSGKTTLAGLIAELFPCNVLHMDDFYLPPAERQEGWRQIPGGNMDFERFREELLIPLRDGRPVVYRPYDCGKGEMGVARQLPSRGLTVIEGSYSRHPALSQEYDLTIFLTCPAKEQKERLQMREGSYLAMFEDVWIPMEEAYLERYEIERGSMIVVDTGDLIFDRRDRT